MVIGFNLYGGLGVLVVIVRLAGFLEGLCQNRMYTYLPLGLCYPYQVMVLFVELDIGPNAGHRKQSIERCKYPP